YLGEPALHEAVVGFLSTALFGPERQTYWRRRLADCGTKQPAAPVGERLKEVTTEVADLERRIERQIANLEAEDATPALRLQVAFQPGEAAVDVEVALFADERSDRRKEVAEVQSVPPGGLGPDLRRLVRLRQRIRLRVKRS